MNRKWLLLATLALSTGIFAKSITLYDQPNNTAKSVGSINLDSGVIPIFTPVDNKDWIKVADPKNGNVGWVKSKDMQGAENESTFTYTQKVMTTGNGPNAYIVQYGVPQKLTPEQSQAVFKKIQEREQALQNDINHLMQNMYQNMHQLWYGYPMIMPVLVVPEPASTERKNADKPAVVTPVKKPN